MKNFYIFDLFRNLIRKKNICAVIYLIINIALICWIFWKISDGEPLAILYGIIAYFVAAVIALSPLGEQILRFTQGCRKLNDKKPEDIKILNRLEPLFIEVRERAQKKQTDYIISDKTYFYIQDDASKNAFACGRRTVCVTSGLLACSNEEIKAILGHEFGHLATHDTDLVLLITVGNLFISVIVFVIQALILFYQLIFSFIAMLIGGENGLFMRLITRIAEFLSMLAVQGIMFLWTQLGVLLVMKTSRDAEYEADSFSCDLGYSDGILSFFEKLLSCEYSEAEKGEKIRVFSALSSSHPSPRERIAKIYERMGVSVEG